MRYIWILALPLAAQNINAPTQLDNSGYVDTRSTNWVRFASVTRRDGVSANLGASGSGKVLTFASCPDGLAAGGAVYLSGGTGTAESAAITATTCSLTGGAAGTATITTANTHVGAWTARSDSSGIREALTVARATDKQVAVFPGTHTARTAIPLESGDSIFGFSTSDRWRSGVYQSRIVYTGTGDLFTITPASMQYVSSVSLTGLNLITTTGRYALNLDATLGAIFGIMLERVTICDTACQDYAANGWTNAINATGAVFDITLSRSTLVDNRGNLININPDHGELGGGNQWSIVNSFLIPTANSTWAIKGVGSTEGAVLGTIHVLFSTIAEAAPTGANGIWVNGGLKIFNSLVEGNGAKAGTIGVRVSGTTGGQIIGNDILTWDKNVQIGDPTHAAWTASSFRVSSRLLSPGTTDVEVVAGGSRLGTEITCLNTACDIDNLRESVDGNYLEVSYDNPEISPYIKDLRGVGVKAGNIGVHQQTSGFYSSILVRNAAGQDALPAQIPLFTLDESGNLLFQVNVNGSIRMKPIAFADLPTTGSWANPGTILPCSDCTPASNPCTGGGLATDGVLAVRSGAGTWVCK